MSPKEMQPTNQIEDDVFRFGEEEVQEGLERNERSALVRFFWSIPKTRLLIQNALNTLWNCEDAIQVIEVGFGLLQVIFPSVEFKNSKLRDTPWSMYNDVFNMVDFTSPSASVFDEMQFMSIWIKLDDIPSHCVTTSFGKGFLSFYGEVEDVGIFKSKGRDGYFVKGKVKLDMLAPFRGKRKAYGFDGREFLVKHQYEGIKALCFRCGLISHMTSRCENSHIHLDWSLRGPWMFIFKHTGTRVESSTFQKIIYPSNQTRRKSEMLPPTSRFKYATTEKKVNHLLIKSSSTLKGKEKTAKLEGGPNKESQPNGKINESGKLSFHSNYNKARQMAITQSDGVLAAKIKEADPSTKHKARSLGEQYIPPHRRGLDTSANTKSTNQRKPVANPGMEGSQLGSHSIQTKRKLTFEEKGKAPTKPVTKANVIIPQFRRNGIVLREPSSPSPVSLSDSSDCSSVGLERNKEGHPSL
ncbi:hypothetical protein LINPERHAP1_LOCUS22013 [Linum perenne]